MINRRTAFAAVSMLMGLASLCATPARCAPMDESGVVTVTSAYAFDETIRRLQADVADKKIMFFGAIEQSKLAAAAGIDLKPSTLLVFGNPPLGVQFLTSNPKAGLDWPVRLLVTQDGEGKVLVHYTDFGWIAKRHHIADREAAFAKASEVIASIAGSVAAK